MSPRRRDLVADADHELLAELDEMMAALRAAVPGQGPGRNGHGLGVPMNVEAVDHLTGLRRTLRREITRARAILGLDLPTVRLATRGQWIPCPHCGCNSLRVDREDWFVWCSMPACRDEHGRRHEWHVRWSVTGEMQLGEVELLGEMAAAALAEHATDALDPIPAATPEVAVG
jgi:hypothetical protein